MSWHYFTVYLPGFMPPIWMIDSLLSPPGYNIKCVQKPIWWAGTLWSEVNRGWNQKACKHDSKLALWSTDIQLGLLVATVYENHFGGHSKVCRLLIWRTRTPFGATSSLIAWDYHQFKAIVHWKHIVGQYKCSFFQAVRCKFLWRPFCQLVTAKVV